MRNAPSHALFLQGEMKATLFLSPVSLSESAGIESFGSFTYFTFTPQEGEQLTIRSPLPEFEEILLSCAWQPRSQVRNQDCSCYHVLQLNCADRLLQAAKLGEALIGEDDEGTNYVLDTVLDLELFSFQSWKFKEEYAWQSGQAPAD